MNAILQILWSIPEVVERWLMVSDLNPWVQVLKAHIDGGSTGLDAMTGNAAAYASLRTWAAVNEGNAAHEALLFLLEELPPITPLFRIIQHQVTTVSQRTLRTKTQNCTRTYYPVLH